MLYSMEGASKTKQRNKHPFNGPLSGTTRLSQYQKGKPIWILLKQDSKWQWHQLGHMQVCTSLQRDNHTSTPPLSFLQARCPSCHPTNSVKALKAQDMSKTAIHIQLRYLTGNTTSING